MRTQTTPRPVQVPFLHRQGDSKLLPAGTQISPRQQRPSSPRLPLVDVHPSILARRSLQ